MKFVSFGGRVDNENVKTQNSDTMYDTYVSKHCLTSRKMINILTGGTAMFVVRGGG